MRLHFRPCLIPLLIALASVGSAAPIVAAPAERLQSAHFVVRYDPDRLSATAAAAARDAAEQGYARCARLFPSEPPTPVECDLTPNFAGATGFALPDARRPRIGVRIADLEYLGL